MNIVRAQLADAERIAPLFDQYRFFYKQGSDVAGAVAFLKERLEKDESVIFMATDGARVLGFVQLYPSFSSTAMKRLWILNDLFVSPTARRSSVGRQLMERAAEFSRETGARGLNLKTAIDNLPAQKLYESLGWSRDDKFYSYILRTSDSPIS